MDCKSTTRGFDSRPGLASDQQVCVIGPSRRDDRHASRHASQTAVKGLASLTQLLVEYMRVNRARAIMSPMPKTAVDPLERFIGKLDVGDCWLWCGNTTQLGYGLFWLPPAPGRCVISHRWLYERLVGRLPEHLVLDHLCRRPRCQNPDHLEPVTQRENVRRGMGHGRETHCPQGHPYDEANTYRRRNGIRQCRTCHRDEERRRRASRRASLRIA